MTQDGLTAYGRLANEFWRRIASGEWAPGARIPSENEMTERLAVSRMTVNRALRELAPALRALQKH